jgi:hypothetical protein
MIYGLFGSEPKDINLGIVYEGTDCLMTSKIADCKFKNLHCQFLRLIDNMTFKSVRYKIQFLSFNSCEYFKFF